MVAIPLRIAYTNDCSVMWCNFTYAGAGDVALRHPHKSLGPTIPIAIIIIIIIIIIPREKLQGPSTCKKEASDKAKEKARLCTWP